MEALAQGYNVHYGARSIKHEVERRVINQLAFAHEHQQLVPHSTIHITAEEQESETETQTDIPNHTFVIKLKIQKKGEELMELQNPLLKSPSPSPSPRMNLP